MGLQVPWSREPWSRVLVYGLGLSGRSASRLLLARGVAVLGYDDRDATELDLEQLAADARFELLPRTAELPRVEGVVVSPGVPAARPLLAVARDRGLPVIAEVELAFPFLRGPLVGITGSNGKSTTTAWTGEILRAAGHAVEVCGNIGRPLADCVDGPAGRTFVTELSSFQLESVATLRPRAAALLNLSPDHLDRHAGWERYVAAKTALFARQAEGDVAVLNADDPEVRDVGGRLEGPRRRWFSTRAQVEDGCCLAADGERVVERDPAVGEADLFRRADLPLPGVHNLENAMASVLLALACGVERGELANGLRSFSGLPHRTQKVAERDGVAWFDDSKGTNVGATARSLEGFPDGSVHLILGGRNKGADPAVLAPVVRRKARRLYLIGEAAEEFDRALGSLVPSERCATMERAVDAAAATAVAGESVLLSPACASFDQYADFGERGDHFQRLVAALRGAS
ncbi:MAG: UDP-N-acetylmuramoyl-L-alanine--D-glutamate ligase [Thermoanaerobaculia bacterium]